MNKKLEVSLVAVVVVLLLAGFAAYKVGQSGGVFGTAINPSNALNQQRLINDFDSILRDVQNVRAPLAGIQTVASSTYTLPTFLQSGATSTLAGFSLGFTIGDPVIVAVNSATQPGLIGVGVMSATSTATITWFVPGVTSTVSASAVGVRATAIPGATFVAPAAITTTTST